MHFISILRASLVAVVVSIVCSSDAVIQYPDCATILGRCANFAIQAGTTVTFDGEQTKVPRGDVGVAPGTSITGNVMLGTGSRQADTVPAQNCATDEKAAYTYLEQLECTKPLADSDLSGKFLSPGVYCSPQSGVLTLQTNVLYLNGLGDPNAKFVFQTVTTVITSANTSIILMNGARARNIYWQVGSSATLGASSFFKGQILAKASITLDVSVNVEGGLYAEAAVTHAGNDTIKLPTQKLCWCSSPINTKQTEQPPSDPNVK